MTTSAGADRRPTSVSIGLSPWADSTRLGPSGNGFGGLRLLLAVQVLASHCFPITGGDEPLAAITGGSFSFGTLAVNAFLLISGFCVMQSWERSRSLYAFLRRRVLRVYPAFLTLSIVTAWGLVPAFSEEGSLLYSPGQLALITFDAFNLVGYGWPYGNLREVFSSNPIANEINGSLWTIRYEFVCYLVLAALGAMGSARIRHRVVAMLGIGMSLSLLVDGFGVTIPWHRALTALFGNWPPWPRFLGYFFAGVCFYVYRERIPYRTSVALMAAVVLATGLLLPVVGHLLGPLASAYFVFWIAFHRRVRLSFFSRRGDFSYGFYLWAFPVQQAIVALLGASIGPAALFAIAAPITLALGALSWFGVERHFLARERRTSETSWSGA